MPLLFVSDGNMPLLMYAPTLCYAPTLGGKYSVFCEESSTRIQADAFANLSAPLGCFCNWYQWILYPIPFS